MSTIWQARMWAGGASNQQSMNPKASHTYLSQREIDTPLQEKSSSVAGLWSAQAVQHAAGLGCKCLSPQTTASPQYLIRAYQRLRFTPSCLPYH